MDRHTSPELQKYYEIEDRAFRLVGAVLAFSEVKRVSVSDLFGAFDEDDHVFLRHAVHSIGATDLMLRQFYDEEHETTDLYFVPNPLAVAVSN